MMQAESDLERKRHDQARLSVSGTQPLPRGIGSLGQSVSATQPLPRGIGSLARAHHPMKGRGLVANSQQQAVPR